MESQGPERPEAGSAGGGTETGTETVGDGEPRGAAGRVVGLIDRLTGACGRLVAVLTLVMVLVGAYNAVVRYLGRYIGWNLSSNAYIEAQWYLFSLIFLLGAAHTLARDGHVRVDVLFSRLSARARALVDAVGLVVFVVPFCIFVIWTSWPTVASSWRVLEGSADAGGLPRYPLKTVIPIAFALLLLQAIAELIKRVRRLRSPESEAAEEAAPVDERPREIL